MIAGGNGSIWPGIQNLLLAARAIGLGAAPTTLALTNPKAVAKVLNLPSSMHAYCLIPVGYPMGKFGPVTRKPMEEIFTLRPLVKLNLGRSARLSATRLWRIIRR